MKIKLIKQKFSDEYSYKILKKEWCCDRLKENPIIDLYDEHMQFENTDSPQVAINYTDCYESWGEDFRDEYFYPIKVCPFCGDDIDVKIVGEEDVTDLYDRLKEQRDFLWEKCQKTDSKKKEQELREQVRDLDDKIDYFYSLCDYNGKMGA